MKKTKKAISLILALALVVSMFSAAVVSTSAAAAGSDNAYSVAAMALDSEYAYDGELGAIYSPESTTFKVWAPLATDVQLNLYTTGSDDEEGAEKLSTTPLEKLMDGDKWTGVWTVTVDGDLVNKYYTYSIENPDHIANSTQQVNHETQDVYSYAVGVNGNRTMIVDLDNTDPEGWDNDTHVFTDKQTEAIVWEVHVKDFSYNTNSGVSDANRGKFLAFTETGTTLNNEGVISTGVDYLKSLGVTYVQINPMYDFATIDEAGDDSQFNWGYDPKNYGVPEGSYSSNPFDGNVRIKEAKEMIQALHEAGIGVIMDVVYNHTFSVDSCFNYSVPEYYYRMNKDGGYSNQSGCGNDTASERAMYRKYMRDMLTYWTNEYHIDGYRFDLMGVHDGETMNLIRDDMDAIDSRIIMYGEGWSGDTTYDPVTCAGTQTFMATQASAPKISARVGFFNDRIRDGVKGKDFGGVEPGFLSGKNTNSNLIGLGVMANTVKGGGWNATTPEQCVSYVSCHDNLTLYDKLVYLKTGANDYRARYSDIIAQNKLAGAIINTSQGIDFLLAGEEMGRSKDGDENSYKSAPTLNMIDWSLLETNGDLVSYYKGLFELRKSFSPFTANITSAQGGNYKYIFDQAQAGNYYTIAYTIHNDTEGEWNKIAVLYNGTKRATNYTFKAKNDTSINSDTEWVIVANDKQAGVTKLGEVKGLKFTIPASSAIVAVEKSTFEACALEPTLSTVVVKNVYDVTGEEVSSSVLTGHPGEGYSTVPDPDVVSRYMVDTVEGNEIGTFTDEEQVVTYHYTDYAKVIINNVYDKTGEVLSTSYVMGAPGESYSVAPDDSISLKYECTSVDGDAEGVFGEEDKTVTFYFSDYVPDQFKAPNGDVNDDGDVDTADATTLQRFFAELIDLDAEHEARGDYDLSGETDIVDVTILQRYEVGMIKSICTLTTNYITVDNKGNEKTTTVTKEYRYGSNYETSPRVISYYVLDETPKNASGRILHDTVVNYNYTYTIYQPTIHVKHSGGMDWTPYLWAWGRPVSGDDVNSFTSWPGYKMTDPDENGWYTTTFNIPGGMDYYFIVSSNGSPQTMDYGPFKFDNIPEIWVVIDDDSSQPNGGDWCSFYSYNPDLANG